LVAWEAYQRYKTLFPNIKELKCCDVDAHKYLEGIQHPHLKILHTVVAGYDGGVDLLQLIRSVAPSIEVIIVPNIKTTQFGLVTIPI
jgi:hypothetical protein